MDQVEAFHYSYRGSDRQRASGGSADTGVAYIYAASPASRQFLETGLAKLCLSPFAGQHHKVSVPGPLRIDPQTCHSASAPKPSLPLTLASPPPVGPQGTPPWSSLTRCKFDLQGGANQSHQRGSEMNSVVVRNRHVHLYQSLRERKNR